MASQVRMAPTSRWADEAAAPGLGSTPRPRPSIPNWATVGPNDDDHHGSPTTSIHTTAPTRPTRARYQATRRP